MDAFIAAHEGKGQKLQMIDSTSMRFHQQAAAQKQYGDYCIGRSRGGLTSKINLRANELGLPLLIGISAGQMHDAPVAELLLKDLPRGNNLLTDRAYDAGGIREMMEDQDCEPVIPPKSNRIDNNLFSKRKYKKRNLVDRCINNLQKFRHFATCYDRKASAYQSLQSSPPSDCGFAFMSLLHNE